VDTGIETYIDNNSLNLNSTYFYQLRAVDNETPVNLSELTDQSACFTGDHPEILVWVGEDAWAQSAASGDTIFNVITDFTPSVYLTKNLFAFGDDLGIYNAIFTILGVYPYNHVLTSEHGIDIQQYLNSGGNLYLEGSDCYNWDPTVGGFNIRPWFSLNEGYDGEDDVFYVEGIDELDTVSLKYNGLNMFMDELAPLNSTSIIMNSENEDILGVWWDGFGSNGAKTIGVVPSYGGLVDTTNSCFKEYLMCRYLNYFGYEFDCDSVLLYCPHDCLPEGIIFTTQEQIDNFQINYPGCNEIEGYVGISGNDITNLNGLNVLTSIGGFLWIEENNNLTDLSGLEALTSIGVSLIIIDNALTSISNLSSLSTIGDDIFISGNDFLTSLSGLNNLTTIGDSLFIWNNPLLTNLSGLDNLTTINGDLLIIANENLISLSGLDNISVIGGGLELGGNNSLVSLPNLNNLVSIGGSLLIGVNDALASLSGLDNLTSISGDLEIINNEALNSLSGLDNIVASSIGDVNIHDNMSLSICDVESICDYLFNPSGEINIYDNAPGCNSPEEVQDSCLITYEDEEMFNELFTISPNPIGSSSLIQYTLHHNSLVVLKILDLSVREIEILVDEFQQQGEQRVVFNSNGLQPGIYFCTLKTNEGIQTRKIIKL